MKIKLKPEDSRHLVFNVKDYNGEIYNFSIYMPSGDDDIVTTDVSKIINGDRIVAPNMITHKGKVIDERIYHAYFVLSCIKYKFNKLDPDVQAVKTIGAKKYGLHRKNMSM